MNYFTPKKIKIGHLGLFEKSRVLYVAMAEKRKIARIATSQKRHLRSRKRKPENTFQYKLLPKTWGKSPQKPLSATRKVFFRPLRRIKRAMFQKPIMAGF